MRKTTINQKGSSMVEMLGVLTIIGMVGMGAIKFIGGVHNVFIQNMVVNEARDLQKVISDRYRFEGNYNDLFDGRNDPDAVAKFLCGEGDNKKRMAPYQMCSGDKMHHRGGGAVLVYPVSGDTTKYTMVFEGLSDTACSSLAQVNWFTRQKSDVYQMVITDGKDQTTFVANSPYVEDETAEGIATGIFPVGASQALAACANGNNSKVQLTFF
ncbi:MAG: hypothetical protein IJ184_06480 [Alphaproteobacteria bacterium]|nr:hypothetical protein [Alphaproteobacteria bacterium]